MEGFKEDRKWKEKSFCFVVVQFELIFIHVFMSSVHTLSSLVRLVTSLKGANHLELCVICEKLVVYSG